MDWIIYSLLFSFCYAIFSGLNRYYQMSGVHLAMWRLLVTLVFISPALFFIDWPRGSLWFYIIGIFNGFILAFSTIARFNLAAQHNGRIASMFMPLQLFTVFVAWTLIDKALLQKYLTNPTQFVGIILCFIIVTGCVLTLRKNDFGWRMFLIAMPIGLGHAVMDVLCKIVLKGQSLWDAATVLIVLSCITGIVVSAAVIAFRPAKKRDLLSPQMLQAACFIGLAGLGGFYTSIMAISTAPNPAYFNAISMLSPVWLYAWHKMVGIEDKANPLASMGMLLAAIGLIIIANG